eukprot:scaffold7859_cov149-Skeletonema_marinoi.AAC.1
MALRRPPTRIELKADDVEEYDKLEKEPLIIPLKRLRLGQGTHQLPTLTSDSQLLSPKPRATDNHLSAVESWVLFLNESQLPSSPQSLVSIRLRLDRTSSGDEEPLGLGGDCMVERDVFVYSRHSGELEWGYCFTILVTRSNRLHESFSTVEQMCRT